MASLRLTKELRSGALTAAMHDLFNKKVKTLQLKAQDFTLQMYKKKFKKDLKEVNAIKTEDTWVNNINSEISMIIVKEKIQENGSALKSTEYLHLFTKDTSSWNSPQGTALNNLKGNRAFCFKKPMPWPTNVGTTIELTAKCDINKILSLQKEGLAIVKEYEALKNELSAFLNSCKTLNHIAANWPEGLKYFPEAPPKKLPIPLIDNVREAMQPTSKSK